MVNLKVSVVRWIFLLFIELVLSGCWLVGPDFEKPQVDEPHSWRFTAKEARDAGNVEWWKLLNDPVLNNLIEEAVLRNLDIKVAVGNVDQYMGRFGTSRANLLPQSTANLMYSNLIYGGQTSSSESLPTTQSRAYTFLGNSINWEIDLWGKLRRGLESSQAELISQKFNKDGVVLSIISQVADQYVTLRSLDKSLEITRSVIALLEEEIRISKARLSVGYISEVDLTQAISEYDRRKAIVPDTEKKIAQTEHAICLLLGKNPGPIKRGKDLAELSIPDPPEGLPSDLLKRRPDVNQAEHELHAATARIGYNIGNYFPQVSLISSAGTSATGFDELFMPGSNFVSVGSMIMSPIISAGKNAGLVQSAEGMAAASFSKYQKTVKSAFKEFEDALIAGSKTKEQLHYQQNRVDTVKKYAHLSKLQYDEGDAQYINVLDSLRQLFDAQTDLINARKETLAASIQLYKAMGGGWVISSQEKAKLPEPANAGYYP